MTIKKGHICEISLLELYARYKDSIDKVKNRDESIELGFEIMKDFDKISLSRGDSEQLASLVGIGLPNRKVNYMDFYCQGVKDLRAWADPKFV